MINQPTMTIPLHTDAQGGIRIRDTRVTLDSILNYYKQGESPEDLHEGFPTIALADIYAIIAYYLNNQTELDRYLQVRHEEAERLREQIEADFPPKITRAELLRRKTTSQ